MNIIQIYTSNRSLMQRKMEKRIILLFLLSTTIYVNAEHYATDSYEADWKNSGICRQCKCEMDNVSCFDLGLTKFFDIDEWEFLREMKPRTVDLSENRFNRVTDITKLPIQVLNLSRCSIESIMEGSFSNLQHMTTLDLSFNKLSSGHLNPHTFQGESTPNEYRLESMRILNLAYNDLHSLHLNLFVYLPHLTELDISGNPFTTIDHDTMSTITSLSMLKVLNMRSCQLRDISDKFLSFPRHLERLDISDNQLKVVPQELREMKNLAYLNLNQNLISELDGTSSDNPGLPPLRKLHELHISNMKNLKRIGPGALAGLENLTQLHMSYNPQLSYIDADTFVRPDVTRSYYLSPIEELYLQSNNLKKIDSFLIFRWELLAKLDVSNNPFLCDCSTQWMINYLVVVIEVNNVGASEKMVCAQPPEMKGYSMKYLHTMHRILRCVDEYDQRTSIPYPERGGAMLLCGTWIAIITSIYTIGYYTFF